MTLKTVFICHPLANNVEGNLQSVIPYAKYILMLGYCPIVPHWYSFVLNDNDPEERIDILPRLKFVGFWIQAEIANIAVGLTSPSPRVDAPTLNML